MIIDKKVKVAVFFGGRSAEHEVSIQSAKNVIAALDKEKYKVIPIKIRKDGGIGELFKLCSSNKIDVAFPVLHGPFGEDGTIQGLLKLMDVPFVGARVLGSAVGMDKDVQKRLLNYAGIPTTEFIACSKSDFKLTKSDFVSIKKRLGLPFFVKPANLGSSVGINKVKSAKDFSRALREAFQFDNKILIEKFVHGREIECSVLGNENPIASLPGEIIPRHEFYSYEAKYIDENGAKLEIPAKLPKRTAKDVQELAVKTFKTLCLEGMARVDFFLKPSGELIVNEVNTIPGFTNISMYPKLWAASGITNKKLVDMLIKLALERHERDQRLKTSYS